MRLVYKAVNQRGRETRKLAYCRHWPAAVDVLEAAAAVAGVGIQSTVMKISEREGI
jgi:hypothetical protein